MITKWKKKIEDTYAAAAFAEAGEPETAISMAGVSDAALTALRKVARFLEMHMTAISFAEVGCLDTAREILDREAPKRIRIRRGDDLATFLETVGLKNIRICYGLASI